MIWQNYTSAILASTGIALFSAYLAHRRGRNPYLWFGIGFLFGLMGIMAIFFAPFQKKKKVPLAKPVPQPYISGPTDKFWYYLDNDRQQKGPLSHNALSKAWKEKEIQPTTLVWNEELTDWKSLQELIQERMVAPQQ